MKSSKVTQKSFIFLWLFIVLATVVTRIYGLTFKPIHFDESINGWFSTQVQQMGYYKYDPVNYHGPLYFYILRFFEIIAGQSVVTLRAVPTVFAIGSIVLFVYSFVSNQAWRLWVAALLLISPAFVFFGRSGIHEMPFAFFQLLFALGILRSFEKKDATALCCLMIGLVGMLSLKETFAITCFSFVVALLFVGPRKLKELLNISEWKKAWSFNMTLLLCFLLWSFAVLFTGFFKNPAGLLDFFRAFLPWMKTGTQGNGHDKPFGYWFITLWYAEPLAILGMILALLGVFSKNLGLRVISIFSLLQFAIYSAIPYKTVWCILSLVWGFYFVIAYWVTEIRNKSRQRILLGVVALGGAMNMMSVWDSSLRYPIDLSHRYVYVNSTYDVTNLINFLETVDTKKTTVQIGMTEQWPWPWLLRNFKIESYDVYSKNILPNMDVYFADPHDFEEVEGRFKEAYWKLAFEFRQEKGSKSLVYLKKSVFPTVPFEGAKELGGEFK